MSAGALICMGLIGLQLVAQIVVAVRLTRLGRRLNARADHFDFLGRKTEVERDARLRF